MNDLKMSKTQDEIKAQVKLETTSRPITNRDRAYMLQYRFVNNFGIESGRVQEKVFWFPGNLKEAKNRARLHCTRMGAKFLYCCPFIIDLDAQEELKARNEDDYQGEYE